jgi:hypothetical protein
MTLAALYSWMELLLVWFHGRSMVAPPQVTPLSTPELPTTGVGSHNKLAFNSAGSLYAYFIRPPNQFCEIKHEAVII